MRSFTVQSATLIVVSAIAGCTLLVPGSNHTRDDAGTDTGVASDAPSDARGDTFAIDAPIPDAGVDAFVASDAGVDAFVAPDANLDAYTPFDAPMPDAFEVPDAYVVPDAWAPDACVPMVGYVDLDGDGYTVAATGCQVMLTMGLGADCNDSNDGINPGAADVTCDGVDNDCDGRETLWGACIGGVAPLPVEVAAGAYHSCVRTEPAGDVWCWGLNNSLQCGSGSGPDPVPPVPRPTLQTSVPNPGAVAICAGDYYTCMARGAAGLDCFGSFLGRTFVRRTANIVEVACGTNHVCYRTNMGRVDCVGLNGNGATPTGQTGRALDAVPIYSDTAQTVIASGAVEVAVGTNFSCARLSGGNIQCWGANDVGQLGRGVAGMPLFTPTPANVGGSGVYTDLATTQFGACGLVGTELRCWGNGPEGCVAGQPTTAGSAYPTPVVFADASLSVLMRGFGSRFFAVGPDGLYAWGLDQTGVMARSPRGSASRVDSNPGLALPRSGGVAISIRDLGHSTANNLSYGLGGHACAIENNAARTLWCWGSNTQSQCGSALASPILNAVQVTP